MTQHPVPQNVIEVEFKLFGSFTLKQFSKILIGALAGVVFFVLPIPAIIKYPLSFVSIVLGIGMAVTPALGTWLSGFVKSLFVSPRYVWIREATPPDILKAKEVSTTTAKEMKVGVAKKTNKLDIDKLDLRQIYGNSPAQTRIATPAIQSSQTLSSDIDLKPDKTSEDNFVRVYEDVFGEGIFNRAKDSALDNLYKQEFVDKPKAELSEENRIQSYKKEIENLKYQLSMLEKDSSYKEKEEQILSRINDIYREIKVLDGSQLNINAVQPVIRNQSQAATIQGKIINGIIVDKKDVPIPNAIVSFVNKQKNVIYRTKSSNDGKFTTGTPIPVGTYAVVIEEQRHSFHTYLIEVENQNLPAFKFREK